MTNSGLTQLIFLLMKHEGALTNNAQVEIIAHFQATAMPRESTPVLEEVRKANFVQTELLLQEESRNDPIPLKTAVNFNRRESMNNAVEKHTCRQSS